MKIAFGLCCCRGHTVLQIHLVLCQILNAVFYDEWDLLARLKTSALNLQFTLKKNNYTVTLPVGAVNLDALASLGGRNYIFPFSFIK